MGVLSVALFATTGCAVFGGGGHEYGRSSLSDAAKEARPDSTRYKGVDDKPLDVGYRTEPHDDASASVAAESGSEDPGDSGLLIGLVGGGGALGGASYDGYVLGGISVGTFFGDRTRVDVIGSVGGVSFSGQSVAGESFINEFELALDFSLRYYLTPSHTLVGVYPIGGVRLGALFWEYAQPITVTENGQSREIRDDDVGFLSFYGGVGTSLMQIRHLHVGMNVTSGVRLYNWQTRQGFSNDLFPATGFFQFMVETTYKF